MRKGFALTIGFFDGVHQGHRYLLQQLEELAAANGLSAAALTFDRHPRTVVQPNFVPSLLTTQEEKLDLLSKAFSGKIIVLPFTQELSEMTAKEFMQNILREKLNAELLLMGYNHRFGHGGGNPEEYVTWGHETGIKVCLAKALAGEKVSSSRIRNLISLGDVKKANNLLGYPYLPEQKLMPACGVYAVWVTMPDHSKRGGMLCIGHRPTVEQNGEISVEVHIFDFNGNLYGTSISIDFIEKLRDERHFDSLEELQKQLMLDAALAQETICQSI